VILFRAVTLPLSNAFHGILGVVISRSRDGDITFFRFLSRYVPASLLVWVGRVRFLHLRFRHAPFTSETDYIVAFGSWRPGGVIRTVPTTRLFGKITPGMLPAAVIQFSYTFVKLPLFIHECIHFSIYFMNVNT
jgi:hypothetical protein